MAVSSRTKLIIALSVCVMLLIVVGTIAFQLLAGPGGKTRQVKVDPDATIRHGQAPAIPAKPESQWLPKFKSVYTPGDGQVLKQIPKPFIPERLEFYRARMNAAQVQAIPEGPEFYLLNYDGRDFSMIIAAFGPGDVEELLADGLGIDETMLLGPADVLGRQLSGDIVVRKSATIEEKAAASVELLAREFKKSFTFSQQDLDRPVIVVSGKFVAAQSQLRFRRENRVMKTWVLAPPTSP